MGGLLQNVKRSCTLTPQSMWDILVNSNILESLMDCLKNIDYCPLQWTSAVFAFLASTLRFGDNGIPVGLWGTINQSGTAH